MHPLVRRAKSIRKSFRGRPADASFFEAHTGKLGGFAEALSEVDLAFANRVIAEHAGLRLAAHLG